jgi:hypothetical protein
VRTPPGDHSVGVRFWPAFLRKADKMRGERNRSFVPQNGHQPQLANKQNLLPWATHGFRSSARTEPSGRLALLIYRDSRGHRRRRGSINCAYR